ncbi:class I SAM-dependent methyltransferase [Acidiphilium sp. AL]|uniref:Class I SAM-dependent methyltransferase n=1 Tax=Acidiphilium iwatense TaxID=768198 RepID=A0ABS9E1Z4_9PROT|nr:MULTISPECIES: class I SAM-dependent methyltransferase [Acidiphilium]MCF3947609.1 class I SAM-dependent methyltransferase [Acidiphilium iwatense]MCU4160775.1 class I SAM-dependent methyltransferase [Acidiphilium sp. AL]
MSWGGGYVTDIAYAPGFYAEQSPRQMALTALVAGFAAPIPNRDGAFHFVDIGCGRGFTALILAAANPGWQVTGLDFNPAHVAAARSLAARAGIANCRFVEADLARFAESPTAMALPEIDAASLHGVWTWVAPPVRDGVLRLLDAKLKPGGLCHVSYDVLPAWRGMLGLQRLMRESGSRLAFRADRQAERGFGLVRRLAEAGDDVVEPWARRIIEHIADKPAAYLAHEFMNENWAPCFHIDVAVRFAEAKLSYAGSARLLENFPDLIIGDVARAIAAEFEDPVMLELIKDVCTGQPLRHDVFIRGAMRLEPARRDAMLSGIWLGLAVPHARRKLEFNTSSGRATMNEALYEPVFARLAQGPASIGELLDVARRGDPARTTVTQPAELAAMLVGTGQAVAVADPAARMDPASVRLNAAMFAEIAQGGSVMQPVGLAVPALGGGFTLPGLAAFAVLRQQDWLNEATIGQALPRPDRATLTRWAEDVAERTDAETHEKITDAFASFFEDQAEMLNALGLVC